VRANYLASPPLVVAYALAGTMDINLATDPIAQDKDGNDVYLKDIWPSQAEIAKLVEQTVTREAFQSKYADVFKGDDKWQGVKTTDSLTYDWPSSSTYVQNPPYFQGMNKEPGTISNVENARVLALLGDMVTTDHISPAGSFAESTPAGQYLLDRQVPVREFNSYGSRRGNHQVMMRGTFANIRIKNEMLDGVEGGYTKGPDGSQMPIYDAAMAHQENGTPLVVVAGQQYGAGSSRDWAAKGTALLGVKAVIAESYERIHRSNLVGMGVIPFEFTGSDSRTSLNLTGDESFSISGLEGDLKPLSEVPCSIAYADGTTKEIALKCRIDTAIEKEYIEHGGVLHYVLRDLAKAS
jgi:aconitate hydratase